MAVRVEGRTWLLRSGVLTLVHAAAETVRAGYGAQHPTSRTLFEAIMLGGLVGVAAVWGAVDTWRNVPERGKVWLATALITGWAAAILGLVGRSVFVDQTGVADLGGALTGGAAFTALLVLVPASIGVLAGRWIREPHAAADEDAASERQRGGSRSGPRS